MRHLFLLTILSTFLLMSCKKYPEGPAFSLRSAEARITGNWDLQVHTKNGTPVSHPLNQLIWQFQRDHYVSFADESGTKITLGPWELKDNNRKLHLDLATIIEGDFEILRLTNKDLWLQQMQADTLYALEFASHD